MPIKETWYTSFELETNRSISNLLFSQGKSWIEPINYLENFNSTNIWQYVFRCKEEFHKCSALIALIKISNPESDHRNLLDFNASTDIIITGHYIAWTACSGQGNTHQQNKCRRCIRLRSNYKWNNVPISEFQQLDTVSNYSTQSKKAQWKLLIIIYL